MKNKFIIAILAIALIFLVACQQTVKEDIPKEDGAGEGVQTQITSTPSEPAVDNVGNDITNIDTVEKDLNTDELGDLDSGLSDIEDI